MLFVVIYLVCLVGVCCLFVWFDALCFRLFCLCLLGFGWFVVAVYCCLVVAFVGLLVSLCFVLLLLFAIWFVGFGCCYTRVTRLVWVGLPFSFVSCLFIV